MLAAETPGSVTVFPPQQARSGVDFFPAQIGEKFSRQKTGREQPFFREKFSQILASFWEVSVVSVLSVLSVLSGIQAKSCGNQEDAPMPPHCSSQRNTAI